MNKKTIEYEVYDYKIEPWNPRMSNQTDWVVGFNELPEDMQGRLRKGMGGGASFGRGWLPTVIKLNEQLAELFPDYAIDQIKEKFGGLRYYIDTYEKEEADDLIIAAELECEKMCEVCGEPGKRVSPRGWFRVRCEEHIDGP